MNENILGILFKKIPKIREFSGVGNEKYQTEDPEIDLLIEYFRDSFLSLNRKFIEFLNELSFNLGEEELVHYIVEVCDQLNYANLYNHLVLPNYKNFTIAVQLGINKYQSTITSSKVVSILVKNEEFKKIHNENYNDLLNVVGEFASFVYRNYRLGETDSLGQSVILIKEVLSNCTIKVTEAIDDLFFDNLLEFEEDFRKM